MNDRFEKIPFISISPTSVTEYFRTLDYETGNFVKPKFKLPSGEEVDMKPPLFRATSGKLTEKGQRNLKKSVYNMMTAVHPDMLLDGSGKDNISFITLTLPTSQIKEYKKSYILWKWTDKDIKRQCLNQFLTEIKKDKGVKLFVWKAEKQINGNIHFHLLVDKRIDYKYINILWNRQLNKLGIIDEYTNKFKDMTFDQYCELRKSENKSIEKLQKAYNNGQSTHWKQPPTTQIIGLKSVKNVAGYIAKYISKTDEVLTSKEKKYINDLVFQYDLSENAIDSLYKIDGRLWQCSQEISKSRRLVEYLESSYKYEIDKVVKTVEDIKVFADEHFTTLCISFSTFKTKMTTIYETYLNHIKTHLLYDSNNYLSPTPVYPNVNTMAFALSNTGNLLPD
ncbi:MAG: hypothetical protein QM751_06190 [Paludibacteraceae bacterium]